MAGNTRNTQKADDKASRSPAGATRFTVEADHPRNADLIIQTIPGLRMRSAIDGTKPIKDNRTGEAMVPQAQAKALGSFPRTPGLRITVDPPSLKYLVHDPLNSQPETLDRIATWFAREGKPVSGTFKGVSDMGGELDEHRMKTLVRELKQIVDSGEARVVDGDFPDPDTLPGRYLLNPGSRVPNSQPEFEDEYDDWRRNLVKSGA